MKANAFGVLFLCFLSIAYLFKNVPQYYTRQVSHQLQKHMSDVESDLAPRELQARHNWAKQKAFLALSEHISQQWISSTSLQWPQGCICSETADVEDMTRP